MLIRANPFNILVVSLCALLSGCRSFPSADRSPNHIVVGIESNPTHLDPRYATDANSVRIGALVYNSLLRADENSRLRTELAESWEMLDERTYLFRLRKGVTFHDGKPLTAADVKFTYDFILDPKNQSPKRGQLRLLRAVDEVGPHEIRFRLASSFAPFLEHCTLGVIPAGSRPSSNTKPPVGSGPFVVESVQPGETVTLKANPNYWEGKPPLSGVIFKIVPDAMVRVLEFKKGTIDFLQNDIEPDTLPWLQSHTDAAIETRQGTTFQYIGINLDHPILRHQKVRQALAHAIDRDTIIRHLLKHLGTKASGLLSPLHWAFEKDVPQWPLDLKEAKRLLDEAGFPDPDGEGPLPRFRLSFKTTNHDLRRRTAEALKEQLGKVGIELEIRTYEWGTFYSDVKKGSFHLYSLAWVGILDPDIYYQIFHSSSIPPNGDNRGRYSNTRINELLERGRTAASGQERQRIYSEVQKILAQDLPYIPLWWVKNVVVRKPNVMGFVPYPDGDLSSLKKVSLSPAAPSS